MSPRGTSRSTNTPYAHRPAPPKSSRQQFSACGACRMRRVRCDLKDSPISPNGNQPLSCTNCRDRRIKCVDEYADVKTVKTLRRGRRLQQVEQVYGKIPTNEAALSPSARSSTSDLQPRQSIIPQLNIEFFASPFFARFNMQHSLLDPDEFPSRYFAHVKGSTVLSVEGQLLAKVLVVWAASFGVDEHGAAMTNCSSTNPVSNWRHDSMVTSTDRRARTHTMVKELLHLIDLHGILRKPTWDGVRVLLLVWPLTHDVQTNIQRITMYESTLSQIYALCSLESPSSVQSGQGPYTDAIIRARIFWYAHVHEGTTNALRGGRLVLNNDDLIAFQQTLPPHPTTNSTPSSSLPSPVSPTFSDHCHSATDPVHPRASLAFVVAKHYFSLTLNLSSVCRHIHTVLTGPKARKGPVDHLDEDGLRDAWEGLERCWDEFEVVRRTGIAAGGVSLANEDLDHYVSSWQVFIFECHNIIREGLKQRLGSTSSPSTHSRAYTSSSSSTSSTPCPNNTLALHTHATRKCQAILPRVLSILRRQLSMPTNGFFTYDAGLVKEGCFFAGFMLAQGDLEDEGDCIELGMDVEDGVEVCLRALGTMEWVFAKSDERQETMTMVWEARKIRDAKRRENQRALTLPVGEYELQQASHGDQSQFHSRYMDDRSLYTQRQFHSNSRPQPVGAQSLPIPRSMTHRPLLAPLTVAPASIRVHSAPSTACTDNGSWGTYTPPSTATTHRSSPGGLADSPPTSASLEYLPSMQQFKTDEVFYHVVPDLDTYVYSGSTSALSSDPSQHPMVSYSQHHDGYFAPNVFSTNNSVVGSPVDDGCSQFTEVCQEFY